MGGNQGRIRNLFFDGGGDFKEKLQKRIKNSFVFIFATFSRVGPIFRGEGVQTPSPPWIRPRMQHLSLFVVTYVVFKGLTLGPSII